jgi:hypothetical protein
MGRSPVQERRSMSDESGIRKTMSPLFIRRLAADHERPRSPSQFVRPRADGSVVGWPYPEWAWRQHQPTLRPTWSACELLHTRVFDRPTRAWLDVYKCDQGDKGLGKLAHPLGPQVFAPLHGCAHPG